MKQKNIIDWIILVLLILLIVGLILVGIWLYQQYLIVIDIYNTDLALFQQSIQEIKDAILNLRPTPGPRF